METTSAAEDRETTIITNQGRPAARIVSIDEAREQVPHAEQKSFVEFMLTFPEGIEFERDGSPMRDVDF